MSLLNKIVTNMEITQSNFIKIPKGSITGISLSPITKYTCDRLHYYPTHRRFLLFPIPHKKEMPDGFYDEELNNLFSLKIIILEILLRMFVEITIIIISINCQRKI